MNLFNRRLLTPNDDDIDQIPNGSTIVSISPISFSPPPSYSLQLLPTQPIFTANVAYTFVILFTALFFIAFLFFYLRLPSSERSRLSGKSADKKQLPAQPYRGGEKDCAICLEEFTEGETVKVIPYCRHVFHPECIDTWLVAHVTCPVCRCTRLCEEGGGEEGRRSEVRRLERQGSLSSERRNSSTGTDGGGGGGGGAYRVVMGETLALRRTLSY